MLSDSDPFRRNLFSTSLVFILYYLAGGQLRDDYVSVQFVNITFSSPHILAVTAWGILFWFALRYYQTRDKSFFEVFSNDILKEKNFALSKYLEKKTGKKYMCKDGKYEHKDGFLLDSIECKRMSKWIAHIAPLRKVVDRHPNVPIGYARDRNTQVSIDGFGVVFFTFIFLIFKKPGFNNHLMPYLVFYLAIALGLYNNF